MARKITLRFRDKDAYLIDEVARIVRVKRAMGMKTTMEFEIARLMKKGLCDV